MKPLLVVDAPERWPLHIPGTQLVSAYDYISDPQLALGPGRKVFNLCRSLRYQATGYYVSLLAEARRHRPLPSVSAIQDFRLTPILRLVSQDLYELIQKDLRRITSDRFELSVYFGHNLSPAHDRLALAIFNAFSAPLVRARFEREGTWRLVAVRAIGLGDVPEAHYPFVIEQAQRYLAGDRRARDEPSRRRFDLAILASDEEAMPPSNPEAIRQFVSAGESLGIACEVIGRDSYGRLAEFDGLFIRETTSVNHHTYRFARRAAAEDLVVLDDPRSIVRCSNKVFLAETLTRHRLAIPRTLIISEDSAMAAIGSLGFPCVIKQPDSAFSAGVQRVDSPDGLEAPLAGLFEASDLLIVQEYLPTEFDWRIGVLAGRPLFACRYGMAPGHWQILHRDDAGTHEGDSVSVAVEEAPPDVIDLAVRAANLMGDGLYGVDLKVVGGKAVVIEVNDNPNIDAGVEDAALGPALYLTIMGHFLRKLEERRS